MRACCIHPSRFAGPAHGTAGSTADAAMPLPGPGWRMFAWTRGGLPLAHPRGTQPARTVRVEIAAQP